MVFDSVIEEITVDEEGYSSLLIFEGVFHQDLINRLLEQMNQRIISAGDEKNIASKVYSILYELMNNILYHAEAFNQFNALGYVIVRKNELEYKIDSGNLIRSDKKEVLTSLITEINAMSEALLKEEHEKRIKKGLIEGKVGEGLGFVQLRKMSDQPLHARFSSFSEHSVVFSVSCTVNRT